MPGPDPYVLLDAARHPAAQRPAVHVPRRHRRSRALLLLAVVLSAATTAAWWDARPPERLSRPAPAPTGSGGYSFMLEQADGSGRPVTFDPCRPIHYVVRPDGQPPSGPAMLADALREVSRATGLVFVADGTTDEAPSDDRHLRRRWSLRRTPAPVLVAWSTAAEWPALAGSTAGEAGPVQESVAGAPARLVGGQVVLDADDLGHAAGDAAGAAVVRLILLHELAHLVGLGHVDDPTQLMHETSSTALAGFGPGDLRGLHVLGSGPCT